MRPSERVIYLFKLCGWTEGEPQMGVDYSLEKSTLKYNWLREGGVRVYFDHKFHSTLSFEDQPDFPGCLNRMKVVNKILIGVFPRTDYYHIRVNNPPIDWYLWTKNCPRADICLDDVDGVALCEAALTDQPSAWEILSDYVEEKYGLISELNGDRYEKYLERYRSCKM